MPREAFAVVTCDNSYTLFVNGQNAGSGKDFTRPQLVNLKGRLKKGSNVIAIKAVNHLPDNKAPAEDKPAPESAANPAGLFFFTRIKGPDVTNNIVTDASWVWSRERKEGWETEKFSEEEWKTSAELGEVNANPWRARDALAGALFGTQFQGATRSALANADPLTVCLGRPSREQVMTTRASAATTLQALELTNGETLARLLDAGAAKLAKNEKSAESLVKQLYRKALGREPSRDEMNLASQLVGTPVQKEGVEDLIWSIAMLPEFQMIY